VIDAPAVLPADAAPLPLATAPCGPTVQQVLESAYDATPYKSLRTMPLLSAEHLTSETAVAEDTVGDTMRLALLRECVFNPDMVTPDSAAHFDEAIRCAKAMALEAERVARALSYYHPHNPRRPTVSR
jgi:hypothetical protein